jgi:hypothetical protein
MRLFSLSLVVVFFTSLSLKAQEAFYGENPELCKEKISIMSTYYKQKAYLDALPSVRKVLEICPQASKNVYIIGEKIYRELLKNENNEAKKQGYVDTLELLLSNRLKYFADTPEEKAKITTSLGSLIGHYMIKDRYEEAYKMLKEVLNTYPTEFTTYELQIFMYNAKIMLQTKKINCDEMLENYFVISDLVANQDEKNKSKFEAALEKITDYSERCLDCEILDSVYVANFASKKSDLTWVDKGIKVLNSKKCTQGKALVMLMEERFNSKPDAETASSLGKFYVVSNKSKAEMYLNKAIELEKDSNKLAGNYIDKAKFNLSNNQFQEAKRNAEKANAILNGDAQSLLIIGDAIAYSASSCKDLKFGGKEIYWVAVDYYQRALNAAGDNEKVKASAQKQLNKFSAYFPEQKDLFLQSLNDGDSYQVGCWIGQSTRVRSKK